jgi:hypothetical protein
MARTAAAPPDAGDPTAAEHRPGGRNPRNQPTHDLGGTPAQPDAPAQSPIDEQQDQQPLQPEPLLNPPYDPSRVQREIKNG